MNYLRAGLALTLSCAVVRGAEVVITAELQGSAPAQTWAAGDIVTLPLTVVGDEANGVCALDVDLTCGGCEEFQVVSAGFHGAFSLVPWEESVLPTSTFHASRARPPETVDTPLGDDSAPILLATLQIQILTDPPFAAPLTLRVKAATAGREKPATLVQVIGAPGGDVPPQAEVAEIWLSAPPAPPEAPPPPPGPEVASVGLEVRAAGGGDPVTVLTAGTTYELHYQSDYELNGFALAAISTSPSHGLASADAAPNGAWSAAEPFAFMDLCETLGQAVPAAEYGSEHYLCDTVIGELSGSGTAEGQLLTFTPEGAGDLLLHVTFWQAGESGMHFAEGQAQIALIVE